MEQLYSQARIKRKVYQLAETVAAQAKAALHVHVIMDGGFMFAADFLRAYEGKVSKVTFLRILRGYSEGHVHPPRLQCKWPQYSHGLNPEYTHLVLDVCTETGVTLAFADGCLDGALLGKAQIIKCALVGNCRLPLEADLVGFFNTKHMFLTGYGMGPHRDMGAIYGIPK